jgi:hypothetical protein
MSDALREKRSQERRKDRQDQLKWCRSITHKCLKFIHIHDFTLSKTIDNSPCVSSTVSIVPNPSNTEQYIVNLRWINYKWSDDASIIHWLNPIKMMNSRFLVDKSMKQITPNVFLNEDLGDSNGLEDLRLFYFQNRLYYSACFYQKKPLYARMSCGHYDFQESEFTLNKHTVVLARSPNSKRTEKNWAYLEYGGELCMVYQWYPLQIGKIDFETNLFHIVEEKKNIPDSFKNVRGSTPGYIWNNEIWFIVHITQHTARRQLTFRSYEHMFVVFDTNMNLVRYSESFKFENHKIEFCTGLIIENERTIVSYSTMDRTSRIGIVANTYIKNGLKWYNQPTTPV